VSNAHAALNRQVVAILLDGSGSMLEDAFQQSDPNLPAQTRSKWKEGIRRAKIRVQDQKTDTDQRFDNDPNWYINEDDDLVTTGKPNNYYPAAYHCYGIWILHGSTVDKVWPDTNAASFRCAGTSSAKDPAVYDSVVSALGDIELQQVPADPGVSTPLADGLCTVLDQTFNATGSGTGEYQRQVVIETDGLENSSSLTSCIGSTEGNFNGQLMNASHPGFYAWAGGLPSGSWQLKVYNKSIGFSNDPNYYDPLGTRPWPNTDVWGIRTSPIDKSNLAAFFAEGYYLGDTPDGRSTAKIALMNVDALYAWVPPATSTATANAMAAASFDDPLRNFFKGMAIHTRGRFEKLQYKASTLPGQVHNPIGDVDDSGCTTSADISQIRQSDTFNRPSNSTPHTKTCDANRDGFVDQADVTTTLPYLNRCRPGCTLATQTACVKK